MIPGLSQCSILIEESEAAKDSEAEVAEVLDQLKISRPGIRVSPICGGKGQLMAADMWS